MARPSSSSSLDPVQLSHGLSLIPRLQIFLSFARADLSVKPIDEWQLRESLKAFIKDNLSISVSDRDLSVRKERDLHKKKRDEPVASGVLYIWDLQGVTGDGGRLRVDKKDSSEDIFRKWKGSVVERLSGVELNMGGMKLKCLARPRDMDDFAAIRKSWEAVYGLSYPDSQRKNAGNWPDTLIITGVPSRWFAEPRVSSKASILVTHTIFSSFGAIRNLDVGEGDLGKIAQEGGHDVSTVLNCHALVQYETYTGFCNAVRAFCGRSLIREGSSYRANYELSWDRDGYFTEKNIRKRKFEKDKLEEHQRRQLAEEARQAEIASRQAELVRLELEKREFEKMERLLREVEEKRKQEIEAARIEEKRRKEEEDQLLLEEELLRRKEKEQLEREQLENELRERQLQQQERQEREKKKRHTQEARQREMEEKRSFETERSQHRLQVEEDFRRLEGVHRRFEEMRSKTKVEKLKEESLTNPEPNEIRGSSRHDREDDRLQHIEVERWVLEDAQSEASACVSKMLMHAGIGFYEPEDDVGEFFPSSKRLRSTIVDSR